MFSSVLIPSLDSSQIQTIACTKAGGLENDELQKFAKRHFSTHHDAEIQRSTMEKHLLDSGTQISSVNPSLLSTISAMGPTLDIISLQMPSRSNNFIGVSLYCDSNGSAKGFQPNNRATQLVRSVGHKNLVVIGDAFIGRYYDNEEEEWIRHDITPEELDERAEWIQKCASENANKNLNSYTTAGQLQQLMRGTSPSEVPSSLTSGRLEWSQTSDEVEIRFDCVPSGTKSKDIKISFKTSALRALVPVSREEELGQEETAMRGESGAQLFGPVIPDECNWSMEGGVVTISLAKAGSLNWTKLTK